MEDKRVQNMRERGIDRGFEDSLRHVLKKFFRADRLKSPERNPRHGIREVA
jgi:hypothetical protein